MSGLFSALILLIIQGVSGVAADDMSVTEGGSVTLTTAVKANQQDKIRWYHNDIRIAEINGNLSKICTDVQCREGSELFRGRLKLDNQTGSLTIMNIRTTDAGDYLLKISHGHNEPDKRFSVTVHGFFSAGKDGVSVFVMVRDSVTFQTGVETNQQSKIRWYLSDTLIAQINGNHSKICTDVQCKNVTERFRGRLKLDQQTGSLTIMNITNTDAGVYELQISSKKHDEKDTIFSFAVHSVSGVAVDKVKEGDSVTLHTDVKTNQQDRIRWYYYNIRIAEINGNLSKICTDVQCNEGTEVFRVRLKLDHQTGSLTISNIRTTDAGDYHLLISHENNNDTDKRFSVTVDAISAAELDKMKKMGESVSLDPGVIKNPGDVMMWYFNETHIGEITGDQCKICTDDQCKERFSDRLKVDHQTGSLNITNTTITDSGLYYLQVDSSRFSIIRSFSVTITAISFDSPMLVCISAAQLDKMEKEGESVRLDPGVIAYPNDVMMWYFNDILIAKITGDQSKICTDVQCDERFRDRLEVDFQTGSLTITNTNTTDSGLYQLQINSSRFSIIRSFSVTVTVSFCFPWVDANPTTKHVFYPRNKIFTGMEGDSVTLQTDVTKTKDDKIKWYFNYILIAQINGDQSKTCTDVQCGDDNERFRDRLHLDSQTGSLTITNTRKTDSGVYTLVIINSNRKSEQFNVSIHAVSVKSVKKGESLTLGTSEIKNPSDVMTWHFNGILIAEITGDQSKVCTDDECKEKFRDRLELDDQTGSLTIADTRTTDSGRYELSKQVTSSNSYRRRRHSSSKKNVKSFEVTVIDSGQSPATIAGISVAVVLMFAAVAAVVIYYSRRSSRNEKCVKAETEKNKQELLRTTSSETE
ncbi:hypothetical protein Q8A67_005667 [Cirrhinus molitorella]|uniref:Ig-like domain-containing protein n=1 Tax=Cirrhinus molitorella TaxID=172907 RepID=A0AA88TRX6_9TELE|nr:hypothetical protein Q8A67_005667 [Cirrhinus molitorella]